MQDMVILINLDNATCRTTAIRLRAEHINCRIMPSTVTADELLALDPRGVLLTAASTGQVMNLPHIRPYLQTGLPMLCVGDAALSLCEALGGSLAPCEEDGSVLVTLDPHDQLFRDLEDTERYIRMPCRLMLDAEQGAPVVSCDAGMVGFRVTQRDVWGLAMPLERNDPGTTRLLLNFCQDVCGCTPCWNDQSFIENAKAQILSAAEDGSVMCALSGGIDSGVCAVLGQLAVGDRLHCIFVDTGLLRKDEAAEVMSFYQMQAGLNVRCIDASEEFLAALAGVRKPREKERITAQLLQDILCREAAAEPDVRLLLQGTNFSDLQLPHDKPLRLPEGIRVLEPVRELYKEEIRRLGEELGIATTMTRRQPFPGSGLASRIMSDVTQERLMLLREADAIFREEIFLSGLNKRLWQYFAALAESPMPEGGYVVTLRAIQSVDGAAAMAARLPGDLLERVTLSILQRCKGVERVMYDMTPSKTYIQQEGR